MKKVLLPWGQFTSILWFLNLELCITLSGCSRISGSLEMFIWNVIQGLGTSVRHDTELQVKLRWYRVVYYILLSITKLDLFIIYFNRLQNLNKTELLSLKSLSKFLS